MTGIGNPTNRPKNPPTSEPTMASKAPRRLPPAVETAHGPGGEFDNLAQHG